MRKQLKKLRLLTKIDDTQEKIQKLYDEGFYTEAFLVSYILSEYISKKLIHVHKAYIKSTELSSKILQSLKKSEVNTQKNNIEKQIKDRVSSYYFQDETNERDYIDVGKFISSLKILFDDLDEVSVKKVMATMYKEENGKEKRDTARNKRNQIVHNCTDISQDDYDSFSPLFKYIFDKIKSIY